MTSSRFQPYEWSGSEDSIRNSSCTDALLSAQAEIGDDALKQILLNLVQNAQEAVGDSGRIEIHVGRAGPNVRIDVTDDGTGIPDDVLSQVFDPFFTTKEGANGAGLGLFTAAGLARSHGGRIAAANRADGGGARLTVEIPLVPALTAEASA